MNEGPWWCRHRVAVDVALAAFFVLLDTSPVAGPAWASPACGSGSS